MAEAAKPGGMIALYGVVIDQALRAKGASLGELRVLRDQVQAVVDAQGDLVAALAELEREIASRSGGSDGR